MSQNLFRWHDGGIWYLKDGKWQELDLSKVTSKVHYDGDFFGMSSETNYFLHSFVQGYFWIAKVFYFIFSNIFYFLASNLSVVDVFITSAIRLSSSIYTSFMEPLYPFLGAVFAIYVMLKYAVNHEPVMRQVLKTLLLVGFAMAFYSPINNGKMGAEILYTTTSETLSELANELNKGLNGVEVAGGKKFTSANGNDGLLVSYFNSALWEPYQGMNGDRLKPDKDGKVKGNGYNVTDAQYLSLLDYNVGDNDFKVEGKIKIKTFAGRDKEVKIKALKGDNGTKIMYATVGIALSLWIGLLLTGYAVIAFALKLEVAFLLLFLPILLVLTLIPSFEHILINFFKKIIGSTFVATFSGVFISIFIIFDSSIRNSLLAALNNNILFATFIQLIIYVIMWKRRKQLGSLLSGGRMVNLGNRVSSRLHGHKMEGSAFKKTLSMVVRPADMAMSLARGFRQDGLGYIGNKSKQIMRTASDAYNSYRENQYQKEGDSPEMAKLKTEEDKAQVKDFLSFVPRQTSLLKNKSSAWLNNRLVKGETDSKTGEISSKGVEYLEKAQLAEKRVEQLRPLTPSAKQKVDNQELKERLLRERLNRNKAHLPNMTMKEFYEQEERFVNSLMQEADSRIQPMPTLEPVKQVETVNVEARTSMKLGSVPTEIPTASPFIQVQDIERTQDFELSSTSSAQSMPTLEPVKQAETVNVEARTSMKLGSAPTETPTVSPLIQTQDIERTQDFELSSTSSAQSMPTFEPVKQSETVNVETKINTKLGTVPTEVPSLKTVNQKQEVEVVRDLKPSGEELVQPIRSPKEVIQKQITPSSVVSDLDKVNELENKRQLKTKHSKKKGKK